MTKNASKIRDRERGGVGAARTRRYRARLREQVFDHYGKACACCGSPNDLTIDHVNGDDSRHRRELGQQGSYIIYRSLVRSGFPEGFQTLCLTCNSSKGNKASCQIDHSR